MGPSETVKEHDKEPEEDRAFYKQTHRGQKSAEKNQKICEDGDRKYNLYIIHIFTSETWNNWKKQSHTWILALIKDTTYKTRAKHEDRYEDRLDTKDKRRRDRWRNTKWTLGILEGTKWTPQVLKMREQLKQQLKV